MEKEIVTVIWYDLNSGERSAVVMDRARIMEYRAAGMARGLDLVAESVN